VVRVGLAPKSFFAGRAIFWFQPGAKDCIGQMRNLVEILREHGHHVESIGARG